MKKVLISLVLFGLIGLSTLKVGADTWFPASIRIEASRDVIRAIARSGLAIDHLTKTHIDLYVTRNEFDQLSTHYNLDIGAGLVKIQFIQTHAQAVANIRGSGGYLGVAYHTYESMLEELKNHALQAPEICKLVEFGKSASEEHSLWAFKISDNVDLEEDEPSVLLVGGIHGNEYPGVEQVLYVIKHLVEHRDESDIGFLIDHTQIWFVPMLNPDGHATQNRYNSNDVDLNRNFPIHWDEYNPYEALSESETRSFVQNLLQKYRFVLSLDYHTYGMMYMYPWGHTNSNPVDLEVFEALSGAMASQAEYQSGSLFDLIGLVYGGTVDYYYGAFGTIALAAELGTVHFPTVEELAPILDANLKPALQLIGRVQAATVTGHVTKSGQPIEAEVYVKGIDTEDNLLRNPTKSDGSTARYYRILEPGTYDFIYMWKDQSRVVRDVEVLPDDQTVLDVDFDDPVKDNGCTCVQTPQQTEATHMVLVGLILVTILYRRRRLE